MKKFLVLIFTIFTLGFNLNFAFAGSGLSSQGIDLLYDPSATRKPDFSKTVLADDLASKINLVTNVILGFMSTVALIVFVYAGVFILKSAGDPKSYGKGMEIIRYTFMGVLIIIFSYGISRFLLTSVSDISSGGGGTTSSSGGTCDVYTDCSPNNLCCNNEFKTGSAWDSNDVNCNDNLNLKCKPIRFGVDGCGSNYIGICQQVTEMQYSELSSKDLIINSNGYCTYNSGSGRNYTCIKKNNCISNQECQTIGKTNCCLDSDGCNNANNSAVQYLTCY